VDSVDSTYWHLRGHSFFWEISNTDLESLCVITGFKKAKKGEPIFFLDEPRIYFLKKGAIKIVSTSEGDDEIIHEILHKGDLFGQLSNEMPINEEEYAVALTDNVVICSFLNKDFEQLMMRRPELSLKYSKIIAFKYKRIANSYNNLFFKSAKERLVIFLTEWGSKDGVLSGNEIKIKNYLTQNDLAKVICTSRQTCSSLINELVKEGKIIYDRKEITLFADQINSEVLNK
jgi:CRP/FNR family transcriptional regulator